MANRRLHSPPTEGWSLPKSRPMSMEVRPPRLLRSAGAACNKSKVPPHPQITLIHRYGGTRVGRCAYAVRKDPIRLPPRKGSGSARQTADKGAQPKGSDDYFLKLFLSMYSMDTQESPLKAFTCSHSTPRTSVTTLWSLCRYSL